MIYLFGKFYFVIFAAEIQQFMNYYVLQENYR